MAGPDSTRQPFGLAPSTRLSTRRAFLSPAALMTALRSPVLGILLVVNFVFVFGWSNVEGTFGLLLERMYIPNPGTHAAADEAIVMTSTALWASMR